MTTLQQNFLNNILSKVGSHCRDYCKDILEEILKEERERIASYLEDQSKILENLGSTRHSVFASSVIKEIRKLK